MLPSGALLTLTFFYIHLYYIFPHIRQQLKQDLYFFGVDVQKKFQAILSRYFPCFCLKLLVFENSKKSIFLSFMYILMCQWTYDHFERGMQYFDKCLKILKSDGVTFDQMKKKVSFA